MENKIQEFKNRLLELGACEDARNWAEGKTAKEAWEQCERGDWLLWWAKKEKQEIRSLTLAKARCAKLVIHLMKDQRSIDAVNVAEQFGLGQASEEDLKNTAAAAYAAYADADAGAYVAAAAYAAAAAAADAAAYAAAAAADDAAAYAVAAAADAAAYVAAYVAADAAADAAAYAAAAAAADAARTSTLKKCAEIVRKNITPSFIELG